MEEVLGTIAAHPPEGAELWHYLQEILLAPHAADALRAMHSLAAADAALAGIEGH